MKNKLGTSLVAGAAMALALTVSSPARAQKTTFVCDLSNNVPATIAQTPRGNVPVIQWVSQHFTGSGWSPRKRCQDVSARFQTYYNNGALNYLTTGSMNGQPVVCVASHKDGPCSGLLFTLKPGHNASQTLQQLMNLRVMSSGPLMESDTRVYIDMNEFLRTRPVHQNRPNDRPIVQPRRPYPGGTQYENEEPAAPIW